MVINCLRLGVILFLVLVRCISDISVIHSDEITETNQQKAAVTISYPAKISIPADIPFTAMSYARKDRSSLDVILPPVLYWDGYYTGWQTCLRECGLMELTWEHRGVPSSSEPYSFRGELQGYNDCVKVLRQLLNSGTSRDELEKITNASLSPLPGYYAPKGLPYQWRVRKFNGNVNPF